MLVQKLYYGSVVVFITVVLFGGKASLFGPIVGAVVVTLLKEVLQVTGVYQMIIYGAFIVAVLMFMPSGIMNSISRLIKTHRSRRVEADV